MVELGSNQKMELSIALRPVRILKILLLIGGLLALISLSLQLAVYLFGFADGTRLIRLFNVDEEKNIPTIFAVGLLLCTALLLAIIGAAERRQAGTASRYWLVLSAGFLIMAIDEGMSFHESLDMPMRGVLETIGIENFYYAWVIPAAIMALVMFLFFLRFLAYLPGRTRVAFLVAGALYLGGALAIEFLSGRYAQLHGEYNLTYSLMTTLEESLEIAGIILFIWTLLTYLGQAHRSINLKLVFR